MSACSVRGNSIDRRKPRNERNHLSVLCQWPLCLPALPRWRVQMPLLCERQMSLPRELPELRLLLMRHFLVLLLAVSSADLLAQEAQQATPPQRPTQVPT